MDTPGLLLINLGTPDQPSTRAVRRYLREFLSDPDVIDIHPISRWVLVHFMIAPFRSPKSAKAYAKIWTQRGSPLLFHLQDLLEQIQSAAGSSLQVSIGMRYGSPSIRSGLEALKDCSQIDVLPLYPQYATASTLSSKTKLEAEALSLGIPLDRLNFIQDFYDEPFFIRPVARLAKEAWTDSKPDHILMSFHGLPERQIKRLDQTKAHCFATAGCCDSMSDTNRLCYRAQSFATARALASELSLNPDQYTVGFQSRMGRTPWIRPYSDPLIDQLAEKGVKHLAVICPSFTADCLETVEEIGIRAQERFLAAGGEKLTLVPCVNSDPEFAAGILDRVRQN